VPGVVQFSCREAGCNGSSAISVGSNTGGVSVTGRGVGHRNICSTSDNGLSMRSDLTYGDKPIGSNGIRLTFGCYPACGRGACSSNFQEAGTGRPDMVGDRPGKIV